MAILAVWDNVEENVLRLDFSGPWDWHAYDAAIDEAYSMVLTVPSEIDILINLTGSDVIPPLRSLRPFQRTLSHRPANVRTFIAVGTDAFACGLCVSFLKALSAANLEAARQMLASAKACVALEMGASAA